MNEYDLDCLDHTTAYDDDHIHVYDPSKTWGSHLNNEEKEKLNRTYNLSGWKMRK